jgi:hypothetical protein
VCNGGDVELRRVPYEVDRTVSDLRAAPLTEEVIAGLESVLRARMRTAANCIDSAN